MWDEETKKKYMQTYGHDWYEENKEDRKSQIKNRRKDLALWFIEYKKTLKCYKCPESDWRCIDFNHRDPKKKFMNVSEMVKRGYSKERIMEEIKKCDPLCANCHRKHHFGNRFI